LTHPTYLPQPTVYVRIVVHDCVRT